MGITPYKEAAKPTVIVRPGKRRKGEVYRLFNKKGLPMGKPLAMSAVLMAWLGRPAGSSGK
jgi:hypothetical protein